MILYQHNGVLKAFGACMVGPNLLQKTVLFIYFDSHFWGNLCSAQCSTWVPGLQNGEPARPRCALPDCQLESRDV